MNEKLKKANALFDACGNIDDFFVTEAALYQKKKSPRFFGALAAGLCAIVIFFAVIPALIPEKPIDRSYVGRLGAQLTARNPEYAPCSAESIDLFDGKKKIVWKTEGEDFYRTSEISASEVELEKKLSASALKIPPEIEDYSFEVYVWIALGDGRVISPYLAYTSGNVGYGEIFDYEPEIIPTDSFSLFIENYLET